MVAWTMSRFLLCGKRNSHEPTWREGRNAAKQEKEKMLTIKLHTYMRNQSILTQKKMKAVDNIASLVA